MARATSGVTASVAIIGAGPCGLASGIALKKVGIRSQIYDRSCLVSGIASYPMYMTFFSTAERITIGDLPFVTSGEKPTRREALGYYRLVAQHFGLNLRLYETVSEVVREGAHFVVRSTTPAGRVEMPYDAVVIATGYFGNPSLLHVPGESLPHVTHIYQEGHEAFRREVIVVGGGNSAVDAALDLWRCGGKVTMVHFKERLDDKIKPWVLPDITNRLTEGSIGAHWGSRVTRIDVDSVTIEGPQGTKRLPANRVYLMTGFTPNVGLLEQLGVQIDAATGIPHHDPTTMETDVPGAFIAGSLASGYRANKVFIENGRGHGTLIAERLAAGRVLAGQH
jgi:thioredoxin reductase (NADPH)